MKDAGIPLSVLALSSRFDGPAQFFVHVIPVGLSVLALSSRFDGPFSDMRFNGPLNLSVLALSSRFDGHTLSFCTRQIRDAFSTRSVESF